MSNLIVHQYPNLSEYAAILNIQEDFLEKRIAGTIDDTLILCEHSKVYTVGRSRNALQNLKSVSDVPVHEAFPEEEM